MPPEQSCPFYINPFVVLSLGRGKYDDGGGALLGSVVVNLVTAAAVLLLLLLPYNMQTFN